MALVDKFNDQVFCSGSLISNDKVLTTLTCLNKFNLTRIKIILGQERPHGNRRSTVERTIAMVSPHHLYNSSSPHYDIGIILLNEKVELGAKIFPVCIPPQPIHVEHRVGGGNAAVAVDFGHGRDGNLLMANVEVLSDRHCNATLRRNDKLKQYVKNELGDDSFKGIFCAQHPIDISTTGGPLVSYDGTKFLQFGLLQEDLRSKVAGAPAVFVDLEGCKVIKFIRERAFNTARISCIPASQQEEF